MKPLISIIVPIYNAESHLEKCIDSIIRQTYNNIQIILVDDGSTDLSSEICDNYSKLDKRITVIHKTNGGVSSSRNTGLGEVSGKYIGFVDSDDWIEEKMYERLYELILNYQANIAICGYVCEGPTGNIIKQNMQPPKIVLNQHEALEMALCPDYFQGFMWNKLFESSIFNSPDKIRFAKRIYIQEDLLCLCQCILKSKTIIFTGEHLYHYISFHTSALNKPFNFKKITMLDAVYQINVLCLETYPQLRERLNTNIVQANLAVMVGISQTRFDDMQLIDKIKQSFRAALTSSLKSMSLSTKEKLYVLLIAINPYWFTSVYRLMKKLC